MFPACDGLFKMFDGLFKIFGTVVTPSHELYYNIQAGRGEGRQDYFTGKFSCITIYR